MPLLVPNRHRGKLIVVEGIDGSGKSTQLSLLSQWLRSQRTAVAFSEWNSSPLVRETTRRGKKKNMFTPVTFSLIHATDFADRLERYIIPLLKAGAVVCADRYAYTAFARDVVRGVGRKWVRNLYKFAVRPNLAFYFRVPLEVAIGRILGGRNAIKFYEAGMDLGLSRNVEAVSGPHTRRIRSHDRRDRLSRHRRYRFHRGTATTDARDRDAATGRKPAKHRAARHARRHRCCQSSRSNFIAKRWQASIATNCKANWWSLKDQIPWAVPRK